MVSLAVSLLSTLRIAVGVVAFIAPTKTVQLLGHPAPASSVIGNRLWASRDAALGGLLFSASSNESVRGALLAGMATDILDIISVGLSLLDGSVGVRAAVVVGGGGVAFLGLGLVALKGLKVKKADVPSITAPLLNEDA